MERESQRQYSWLSEDIQNLGSKFNFFQLAQLIEKKSGTEIGINNTFQEDPVKFKPHPGMGFPSSEIKKIEYDEANPDDPPVIRTTFLGLYGVDSPMPTQFIDEIVQQRDGFEAVSDFLDIFNHRILSQYYRIWKKYNYPISFESGGVDKTSQCMLGLIGLGIGGTKERFGAPISRFLALLGPMRLPTRTAEGLVSIVGLISSYTIAQVKAHSPVRVVLNDDHSLKAMKRRNLADRPVLGKSAVDCNSQVELILQTENANEAQAWLPGEPLYRDLLILLRGYIGYRFNVKLTLSIPIELLPATKLKSGHSAPKLGRSAVLGWKGSDAKENQPDPFDHDLLHSRVENNADPILVSLGTYKGLI